MRALRRASLVSPSARLIEDRIIDCSHCGHRGPLLLVRGLPEGTWAENGGCTYECFRCGSSNGFFADGGQIDLNVLRAFTPTDTDNKFEIFPEAINPEVLRTVRVDPL